jgi:hypothetical protein
MTFDEAMQVQEQLADARERIDNVIDFLERDDERWDAEIGQLERAAMIIHGQIGNF